MTARSRTALAESLWLAGVVVAAASLVVSSAHRSAGDIAVALSYQVFTTVGALLLVRRPSHPIGPLFLVAGLTAATQGLAEAVVERAQAHHQLAGTFVHVAAWAQSWMWLPAIVVPLVFVTLLFPDGRPASPRWRLVLRLGIIGVTAGVVPFAVTSVTMSTAELVSNNPPLSAWQHVAYFIAAGGILLCLGCAVLGVASMVVRYRRGAETTRQQAKLVLFATAVALVLVVLGSVIPDSQNFLEPFGTSLIAMAVAVAVMRYRLFEVDRLISRTLSYAVVTGLLVATYVGGIALLTDLGPFSSSVGVAATTLVVAAAFNPLRRRVQAVVDRRFNRARYDAARTVEQFAVRLRDEVDPDLVRDDLIGVAARAVQPSSISLWTASAAT